MEITNTCSDWMCVASFCLAVNFPTWVEHLTSQVLLHLTTKVSMSYLQPLDALEANNKQYIHECALMVKDHSRVS